MSFRQTNNEMQKKHQILVFFAGCAIELFFSILNILIFTKYLVIR